MTEDTAAPQDWQARPRAEGIPHIGRVWVSDGKKVWIVDANGTPNQFIAADAILFWMPAVVPAPPPKEPV